MDSADCAGSRRGLPWAGRTEAARPFITVVTNPSGSCNCRRCWLAPLCFTVIGTVCSASSWNRVTVPVATTSTGTLPVRHPVAATIWASTAIACGSRCGGCCAAAWIETEKIETRRRAGRVTRMGTSEKGGLAASIQQVSSCQEKLVTVVENTCPINVPETEQDASWSRLRQRPSRTQTLAPLSNRRRWPSEKEVWVCFVYRAGRPAAGRETFPGSCSAAACPAR